MAEGQRSESIMIVDDTPENLGVLEAMLRGMGYRVQAFPRGSMALAAARHVPPDLILLDINMPVMDGYEVCRLLKADRKLRPIPVIFISAQSELAQKVRAFEVGGVDYVVKPFQLEEVKARVEAQLAVRRLQLELWERNRELKQALADLREIEKLKGHLTEMIVHDLKNPLATILLNIDAALTDLDPRSEVGAAVSDASAAAQDMDRMILNILDVLQLDKRGLRPSRRPVDPTQLVHAAVTTLRPRATLSSHELRAQCEAAPPSVPLDADLMRRVLENMLENAIKYSPHGSKVVVSATGAPDGLRLEVSDEGRGIATEHRERVFDVHTRLERDSDVEAPQSRGLGLAFCKIVVEAHGGKIWIEDAVPHGSRFFIHIPRAVPEDASAQA